MKSRFIICLISSLLTISFASEIFLTSVVLNPTGIEAETDKDLDSEEEESKEENNKLFQKELFACNELFLIAKICLILHQKEWNNPTIEINSPPPDLMV